MVAQDEFDQMPPAVRQALKTLEAMDTGIQTLMTAVDHYVMQRAHSSRAAAWPYPCGHCGQRLRPVDA